MATQMQNRSIPHAKGTGESVMTGVTNVWGGVERYKKAENLLVHLAMLGVTHLQAREYALQSAFPYESALEYLRDRVQEGAMPKCLLQ